MRVIVLLRSKYKHRFIISLIERLFQAPWNERHVFTTSSLIIAREMTSKSLPATEFQVYISSADSGIDSSDSASNSTAKLNSSLESFNDDATTNVDPKTLLAGKRASHAERVEGIGKALDWLRAELIKMKETDKKLTKSFIKMRSKIAEHKEFFESGGLMAVECQVLCDSTVDDCTSEMIKKKAQQTSRNGGGGEEWNLIARDGAFPTNGLNFENNKRATWVI